MARQVRIEYAGAVYHVMARGNQGRPIFADDLDRKSWLNTLGQACEKTGWRIDAWVWMRNHYHLLKLIQAALGEGRAASYAGAAKRAHGEAEAERWLGAGLKALGLEAGSLPERPKGLAEKQVGVVVAGADDDGAALDQRAAGNGGGIGRVPSRAEGAGGAGR